jgi:histidinol-phosphate aminotransferase
MSEPMPPTTSRRAFLGSVGTGAAAVGLAPLFSRALGATPSEQLAAGQPQTGPLLLNFNENPYGPSPAALAAVRAAATSSFIGRYYSDWYFERLTAALAKFHELTPEHVLVSAGSTEMLKICDDVFLGDRASVVVAEPAYEAVLQYAANSKATATRVALTADHRHDLERMAAATTSETGMVYICNPNNPTGTIVRRDELARFMGQVHPDVPVVVDEAYADFVTDPGFESALRYVREGRNVIVVRTFSKAHGMAGMRVGYAIARPAVIARIRPFTVDFALTGLAVRAVEASLADRANIRRVSALNAVERQRFMAEVKRAGFECAESHANFVMVNLRQPVAPVIDALAKRGVLVGREFPAMPTFLRVTLGTAAEMTRFYPAFREVMRSVSPSEPV